MHVDIFGATTWPAAVLAHCYIKSVASQSVEAKHSMIDYEKRSS